MKTCFATVIYKQAEPFFEDYLRSVDNQSNNGFELLIINDNYDSGELKAIETRLDKLSVRYQLVDLKDRRLSIAGTRIEMLRAAKDLGYDLAILGDADDTFSTDRVEAYKKAYELDKQSVFFYNKLVTDKGDEVFKIIPEKTLNVKEIAQSNYLGMSISAIKIQQLSDEFLDSLKECDSPVFDWYLFSRLLLENKTGALVKDAATIYRIYDSNMVGTTRDIRKEHDVKKTHYESLANRSDYFRYLLEQLEKVDLDKIQANPNHLGYWWSDIQLEDSYEI